MFLGFFLVVLVSQCWCEENWRWPDGSTAADLASYASEKIDAKVKFLEFDNPDKSNRRLNDAYSDEASDSGRPSAQLVRIEPKRSYYNHRDDTEDGNDLQYCKCVPNPECRALSRLPNPCDSGKYLCCYKHKKGNPESFNEIEDERPMLLPGRENFEGPFPQPPGNDFSGGFGPGHGHDATLLGSADKRRPTQNVLAGPDGPTGNVGPDRFRGRPSVLVGPDGPSGQIGPNPRPNVLVGPGGPTSKYGYLHNKESDRPSVLVGPEGATGRLGPLANDNYNRQPSVLVGPGGPSGKIGPDTNRENSQIPVLVGPNGPSGRIGPDRTNYEDRSQVLVGPDGYSGSLGPNGRQHPENVDESAQRGVLVGPGGPTGIIGPGYGRRQYMTGYAGFIGSRNRQRPVLVGPGGPTGMIGPYGNGGNRRPGLLVGPGGPTGTIGPGRQVLVGPGGPTGRIGPFGF